MFSEAPVLWQGRESPGDACSVSFLLSPQLVFYRWKMVSRANLAFVWPSLFAAHSPSSRVSPYSQAGPAANSCPSRRASSSSAAASLSAEGADASRHEEGAGASSSRLVVWPTCLSSPLLPASQAPLSPRYFGAWRYFVVTGFCDACGNILGFIAQPFVPGPLFSLATQAIVPFSCLCSMLLLKRRYSLAQVGALLLVTAGFFVAWYPLVVPHVHRTGRWSFLNGLSRLRAERLSGKTGGALLDTNAPLHLLKRTETGETGGMGARRHTEEGEIVQRAFSNVEEAEREPAVWAGPREENKRRRSAGALMEDARVMQLGEKQGRACSFSTSVPSYVFEIFPYDPSVQLPPRVPGSRACSIAGAHRTSTPVLPSSSFPLAPTLARPSSSGYTLPSPLSDHSLSVFLRPFEQLVHAAYGPPGRPALVATGTGDGLVLSEGGPAEFQQRAMLDTEQPSRGARPRNAEWRDSAAPEKEESRQVGVPEEIRVKAERAGEEIGHEDKETNPQVTFKEAGEGGNLANDYEQRQRRQMEPRGPTESQQNHRAFWLFAEPPPRRAYSGAAGGVVRTKEGGLDKGQRGEDSLLARKLITGTAPSSETGENKVHTKPRPAGGDGVVEDNEYKRGSEGQSRTDVGPAGLLEAGQREQARGDSQSPGEPQRGTHPYVLDRVMGQTEEETVRKPALYLAASAARGDGKSALLVPSAGVGWYEHGAAPENPEPTPSEGRPRTGFEPDGEGEKELLESRPFEGKAAEAFSGERKAPGLRGPEPAKGVWSDVLEETAPRSESESEGPAVWLYTLLVAVSTLPTALSFAIKEKLLRDFEEKHGWASGPANGARGNTFFVPSEDGTMRTVRAVGSATLVYTGDEADTEEQSGGEGAGREGCSRTDEEGLVEENLALASEGMEGCGAVGLLSLAERRNKDIRVRRSLLQTSWFPEGEGSEETASVREGQEKDVSACAGDQGQRSVARGLTRSRRNSSGAAGEAGLREAAGDARGLSREGGETNKERLHVLVLCAHGSAFQLMWVLLSIPLSVCAGQVRFDGKQARAVGLSCLASRLRGRQR